MRSLAILVLVAVLSACGFQLRGSYSLPWETLYVGLPEFDPLRAEIKRNLEASTQTRIVNDPKEAKARLVVTNQQQLRSILSLNAKGYVREVQLTRIFAYRIVDADNKELAPAGQILLQREMTFDDDQLLAKGSEEGMIVREMQSDLVQQLMRRLSAAKLKSGT
jgi:LPS-assembly lipoprotein